MIETESRPDKLSHPKATLPKRRAWAYLVSIATVHVAALAAFYPAFFSWSGLALAFAGLYVFGTLGINLCYHRLLTHRGLELPKWLERAFALLGVCCMEESPARWVAIHRMHHQHSDEEDDPHSPLVSFAWSHFGWLFTRSRDHESLAGYERYSRDLLRDPFYFGIERGFTRIWIYVIHAVLFFAAGTLVGSTLGGGLSSGLALGSSWLVWGVFVRTVAVWHVTWSVNSLGHVLGYRNYETRDHSRNNWFVALISNGEGWHNNHHWDQRCAAHGHKPWELDVTYWTVLLLEFVGLATKVVHHTPQSVEQTDTYSGDANANKNSTDDRKHPNAERIRGQKRLATDKV